MRKILVSACLYGEKCKYNALDNTCLDPCFQAWKKEGRLIPVCPEVLGGLSVPRNPSERQFEEKAEEPTTEICGRVVTNQGKDVTQAYLSGSRMTVQVAKDQDVICCILKHRSPACGSSFIYDGTFTGTLVEGQGVATELLRKAGFRVFTELQLDEVERLLAKEGM